MLLSLCHSTPLFSHDILSVWLIQHCLCPLGVDLALFPSSAACAMRQFVPLLVLLYGYWNKTTAKCKKTLEIQKLRTCPLDWRALSSLGSVIDNKNITQPEHLDKVAGQTNDHKAIMV